MAGATIHAFPTRPRPSTPRSDSAGFERWFESAMTYLLLAGIFGLQAGVGLALAGIVRVGH